MSNIQSEKDYQRYILERLEKDNGYIILNPLLHQVIATLLRTLADVADKAQERSPIISLSEV